MCFQAYSSLGTAKLVTDPVVMEVAKACERTPAQVITVAKHPDESACLFGTVSHIR